MAGFDPIYNPDETKKLSKEELQKLRCEIFRQLSIDNEIRELIKRKTQPYYNELIKNKP
jgi:hypothetical protein